MFADNHAVERQATESGFILKNTKNRYIVQGCARRIKL